MFQSIVFTLLSLASAQEGLISNCGTSTFLTINGIGFEQNPLSAGLVPGKDVITTITGRSSVALLPGTTVTTIYKMGDKIISRETNQFCEKTATGHKCPSSDGKNGFKYQLKSVVPRLPIGKAQVQFEFKTPKSQRGVTGCTAIIVNVVEPPKPTSK
jgi:hypothetical protein